MEKELAEVREQSNALKAKWKLEKDVIAKARALKEKLEHLKIEEQAEERKGNLERVAQIRYGLIRQTEEDLKKITEQMEGGAEESAGSAQTKAAGGDGISAQAKSKAAGEGARATRAKSRMLKEEVDEEDVARIVSKWTGIPVSKMLEG